MESKWKKNSNVYIKNRCEWSDENAGEQEELIEDLNPIFEDKKLTIEKKGKAQKNMIKRKKRKLVILKRLDSRKASTSRL